MNSVDNKKGIIFGIGCIAVLAIIGVAVNSSKIVSVEKRYLI